MADGFGVSSLLRLLGVLPEEAEAEVPEEVLRGVDLGPTPNGIGVREEFRGEDRLRRTEDRPFEQLMQGLSQFGKEIQGAPIDIFEGSFQKGAGGLQALGRELAASRGAGVPTRKEFIDDPLQTILQTAQATSQANPLAAQLAPTFQDVAQPGPSLAQLSTPPDEPEDPRQTGFRSGRSLSREQEQIQQVEELLGQMLSGIGTGDAKAPPIPRPKAKGPEFGPPTRLEALAPEAQRLAELRGIMEPARQAKLAQDQEQQQGRLQAEQLMDGLLTPGRLSKPEDTFVATGGQVFRGTEDKGVEPFELKGGTFSKTRFQTPQTRSIDRMVNRLKEKGVTDERATLIAPDLLDVPEPQRVALIDALAQDTTPQQQQRNFDLLRDAIKSGNLLSQLMALAAIRGDNDKLKTLEDLLNTKLKESI